MGRPIKVTLDTGVLDASPIATIRAAVQGLDVVLAITSVNARERGYALANIIEAAVSPDESLWIEGAWGGRVLLEVAVLDESLFDVCVLGGADTQAILEAILAIISNGGFPAVGDRDALSGGHRHQLRDTMAFEAHMRDDGDYFVTTDAKGFVKAGRRDRLEVFGETRVATLAEFLGDVAPTLREGSTN